MERVLGRQYKVWKSVLVLSLFFVTLGCGQKASPEATLQIERVLNLDNKTLQNQTSAVEVLTALQGIDIYNCPNDFRMSFIAYRDTWELMALVEHQLVLEEEDFKWRDVIKIILQHSRIVGSATAWIPIILPSDFSDDADVEVVGELGWILTFASNQIVKTKQRMNQIAESYGCKIAEVSKEIEEGFIK